MSFLLSGIIGSPLAANSFVNVHSNIPSPKFNSSPGPCSFTALKFAENKLSEKTCEPAPIQSLFNASVIANMKGRIGPNQGAVDCRKLSLQPFPRLRRTKTPARRKSCLEYFCREKNLEQLFSTDSEKTEHEIQITKMIGRGGFGKVYLGVLNQHKVAVKKLHAQSSNMAASVESFKAEMNAKTLRHPNIVRIFSSTEDTAGLNKAFIVMEYVGNRNVQQIIDDPSESLSPQRRISFALDISRALAYIHKNSLVHLDVKPANVLVTTFDTCKLGDFGCCQVIENETGRVSPTNRSQLTGTHAYRAPELLCGEVPGTMADIYSFAITLWQLASRSTPYSGIHQHAVIFGVVANNLRPDLLRGTGSDPDQPDSSIKSGDEGEVVLVEKFYEDTYVQCWHRDPEKRISAKLLVDIFSKHLNDKIKTMSTSSN